MNLARFPRRRYTIGKTPLEFAARFSDALGAPRVYIKRDDLLGLAGGGNKTRKLEFFVADALSEGADTLITCGALQSNHCRLTLAAAVKAMAGLIDQARKGFFRKEDTVVFVHTGGSPALYVYEDYLLSQ